MVPVLHTFHRNEVFAADLRDAGARFLIVGSLALHHYVPERQVNDLDLLIEQSPATVDAVIAVLTRNPLLKHSITVDQLLSPGRHQIPVKIDFYLDLLTPGGELNFEAEWGRAKDVLLGSVPVKLAAPRTLRTLLAASPEAKHKRDLELLARFPG